jgi:hypothetical protein
MRAARGFLFGTVGNCRCYLFVWLLAGFWMAGPVVPQAAAAGSKEYQIKAAFLFNFAQFVEWPSSAFASPNSPFRIGILGDDPFGGVLRDMVRGESVRSRRLTVQQSNNVEDLRGCQLMFVSRSERGRVAEILSALDQEKVLIVSDIEGFARRGGAIYLYLEGGKVRFEINPGSARRRNLKVSSQLLGLGRIVEGSAN